MKSIHDLPDDQVLSLLKWIMAPDREGATTFDPEQDGWVKPPSEPNTAP